MKIDFKDIDKIDIDKRIAEVNDNSKYIDEIICEVVDNCCEYLDKLVSQIKDILQDINQDIEDKELELMVLNLPVAIYETTNKLELLGVRDDVATAYTKEIYNKVQLETEGKVGEKIAAAELASQKNAVVSFIMSRSYKIGKNKIEAGYELLSSVKKVLSMRITLAELSRGNV